jgi:hypothetical protein
MDDMVGHFSHLTDVLSRNVVRGLRKNTNILVIISGVSAEIRTEHFPEYESRSLPIGQTARRF